MPDDARFDNEIRLALYRFFVEHGRPPVPAEVAASTGHSQHEVEAALERLAGAHVIVLAPGTPYIWMANPLSAIPTPFQVDARGREWFGNCIWDALGIVAMLGDEGGVRTPCPDCGEPLALAVRGGQISGTGIIHFAVPAARWWEDIGFT